MALKQQRFPFTGQVVMTLCISSLVSVLLLVSRMIVAGNTRFWFMLWNLFLAWLPLLFSLGFRANTHRERRVLTGKNVLLIVLWLGFLPNSFYLMSDLIHLQSSGETSILYDIAMMLSFIFNGLVLGYMSIYIVHKQFMRYFRERTVNFMLGMVFLSCGFAIYLGRYLRWNTWDILVNPAGILFDLSERVINPVLHFQTYLVTLVFAGLLAAHYAVIFQIAKVLARNEAH